jgi:hypothetical protein
MTATSADITTGALEQRYDPDNIFHRDQNIQPGSQG